MLFFLILFWCFMYFESHGGLFKPQVYAPYASLSQLEGFQPPTGGVDLGRGRAQYENVCALCHNPDGAGKPNQAPPLAGSEWVLGSPDRLIRIPLNGLSGPLQVKGQPWNLAMPAMGATLSDDDLAAVLTYMRQTWGNKASTITPEQVKAIRAQTANRPQPWTAPELEKIP
jgi:mono/diheme cytochrome c family protein